MRFTQVLSKVKHGFELVADETKRFSNLPDRYIKRAMEQVYYRTPRAPNYWPGSKHERKLYHFGKYRPWTQEFYMDNLPGSRKLRTWVEPIDTWSYFLGDRVEVLVGKDKGKQGYVKQIIQERNWVFVEGLHTYLKEIKGHNDENIGTFIREESPLLVTTDVCLVDPADLKATEFEWRYLEDGTHVRVSTRTGRVIPLPPSASATIDYKSKATYFERDKDTKAGPASAITFKPTLKTFEMDIMEEFGIKEDRTPAKTYWY